MSVYVFHLRIQGSLGGVVTQFVWSLKQGSRNYMLHMSNGSSLYCSENLWVLSRYSQPLKWSYHIPSTGIFIQKCITSDGSIITTNKLHILQFLLLNMRSRIVDFQVGFPYKLGFGSISHYLQLFPKYLTHSYLMFSSSIMSSLDFHVIFVLFFQLPNDHSLCPTYLL